MNLPDDIADSVDPIDVTEELRDSFLEYAYSVIVSRALPDARDGLKPVHRRIIYQMHRMGLMPGKGYVKSARVVGDVMGKLHPHGDSAIYDAMVRLAQPWAMSEMLVDGHGNFGSPDDGPAASRYTEARLAAAAIELVTSIDEDTVDMRPNYDDREVEPTVLPSAYPNLLVNGAAGIAVGMATNIPTHNISEVIAAARYMLDHRDASLSDLMEFIPGPDFPTGGSIVGTLGIQDAYTTGRGQIKVRAKAAITDVSARRKGIEITELPYGVGPEKIIAAIKAQQDAKRLQGVSRVVDLTDRKNGLKLVIEVKSGANPAAVLAELYKRTPLEDAFNVNAVALVDGAPKTLGLVEMLSVYLDHRIEVVRRRCQWRRARAMERAHIVEGMLIALAGIDEVVAILRASKDSDTARKKLKSAFSLSDIQVNHILEMPLRRLTSLEVGKLKEELAALKKTIAELTAILDDPKKLTSVVSEELAEVGARMGRERRTVILDADEVASQMSDVGPEEVPDTECILVLGASGLLGRTAAPGDHAQGPARRSSARSKLDVAISALDSRTRAQVGVLTDLGRVHRLNVIDVPALGAKSSNLKGSPKVTELVELAQGEQPLALVSMDETSEIVMGTTSGLVKRLSAGWVTRSSIIEVISLKAEDRVVGASSIGPNAVGELVLISDDAQLLRFDLGTLRAQGRSAGGVAGIKLSSGARMLAAAVVPQGQEPVVVTVACDEAGTEKSTKVTSLSQYPAKGRATGGVRCMRLLRGESRLSGAAVVVDAVAATASGDAVDLPAVTERRDGTGSPTTKPVQAFGTPVGAHTL